MEQGKKPWLSKTIWIAFLTAVAAFIPPVAEFIKGNPETFAIIVGMLFTTLRVITKGKVDIV